MKRRFFPALAVAAFWCFLAASLACEEYVDSSEVRARIADPWLSGELDRVARLEPALCGDRWGSLFRVSGRRIPSAGLLEVSVVPESDPGAAGSWFLYRRLADGQADHLVICPSGDPSVRLVLKPDAGGPERGRSLLDLEIRGFTACREIPVGLSLVSLYAAPLSTLRNLTPKTVPWDLLEPDPSLYGNIESAAETIAGRLGSLVYLDDGAFDENGKPVLIRDGSPQDPDAVWAAIPAGRDPAGIEGGVNCSGFAKWLVDGIVRPAAGSGLYIAPLKDKTDTPDSHFTEIYTESRDLFFALDWTRNLASAVVTLNIGRTVRPGDSFVDVTVEPFAGSVQYSKNVGYSGREIIPLLYALAVREPGNFYLGAVSRERGDPKLRQYHHVAAFFPYFGSDGRFTVRIFESATETPPDVFVKNNSDAYINLVRIEIPEKGYFRP
jgi:hypothetical protein